MTTFNSTDEPILFPKNSHPMLSFIKGDTKDKFNIITNHPQDEGVTFVENEDIKISYLPKVILEVDVKENSKQSVGYVTDELDDYNIVTVKKKGIILLILTISQVEFYYLIPGKMITLLL